jgi:pimeloyl-ACP methyl ester carboxylesterase
MAEQTLHDAEVSVLGYRMAYVTGGAGEPIVFLHGLGHAALAWNGVLPALAQHFRVFAVDMLGCGRSDKPRIDYSLWALATYIRYFLDAVSIERAHLVGHSLGGGIALHMSIQYPERVQRVALLSSGGLGRELRPLLRVATLPGSSLVLSSLLASRWDGLWERLGWVRPHETLYPEKKRMRALLAHPDHRWAFLRMLRSVSNITGQTASAVQHLSLFAQPMLLIWGGRDRTIPLLHAQRAVRQLKRAHLEILPECGHYPHLEQPAAVARLLEQFLQAEEWPPATMPPPQEYAAQ